MHRFSFLYRLFLLILYTTNNKVYSQYLKINKLASVSSYINDIEIYQDSIIVLATPKAIIIFPENNTDNKVYFSNYKVNTILTTKNEIWIGTYKSELLKIRSEKDDVQVFSFKNIVNGKENIISTLFETEGEIWLGTLSGFVLSFDKKTLQFSLINSPTKSGIKQIFLDQKSIWIRTYDKIYYKKILKGENYLQNKWKEIPSKNYKKYHAIHTANNKIGIFASKEKDNIFLQINSRSLKPKPKKMVSNHKIKKLRNL